MTYEEAIRQCDPFDTCYIWRLRTDLVLTATRFLIIARAHDPHRLALATCCHSDRIAPLVNIVENEDTWKTCDQPCLYQDEDLWRSGNVEELLQWARGLFNDV